MDNRPIILWFRRDLRLSDHPALREAAATGRALIPVFILDEVVEDHGAAPKLRLGLAVEAFGKSLEGSGSRLVLRRGPALATLRALIEETGAGAVWWTRLYDGASRKRDEGVKSALKADGLDARSFPGHVLFEPWTVETGQGGFYKVYTPYWKAVRSVDVGEALSAPGKISAPETWPKSDCLADWKLDAEMRAGASIVAKHQSVGEEAARGRLGAFIAHKVGDYADGRDFPAREVTSGLSENLTYGEISARSCWHAGLRARDEGKAGAETFLKELCWREFAYHLVHHTPHMETENWRTEWTEFPWKHQAPHIWLRGRTGVQMVDAGLREMYVTGTMHNRVRMIVASYLTKHLLVHWRAGQRWFEDCLTDWDPASNAMGWQWVAGSGPDASPYFRVFNPETQAEKFDPDGAYRRKWLAEGQRNPPESALSYFEAIPKHWDMSPEDAYPTQPDLSVGRQKALDAYERWKG